jgi:hypothetical protein
LRFPGGVVACVDGSAFEVDGVDNVDNVDGVDNEAEEGLASEWDRCQIFKCPSSLDSQPNSAGASRSRRVAPASRGFAHFGA